MLIAHISDFHVFADQPETSLVRADAAEAARKVVADLAAHQPALDAVAFTGDLTDGGSMADYALLRDILAPLQMPVFVVPGNHDAREGFRRAFADNLAFENQRTLNYATEIGDIRILALDTLIEGAVPGALEPAQLEWLDDKLSQPHPGPTMIVMHHPPFPSGVTALDAMALQKGKERLARMVAAYGGDLTILAGHIHRPYQAFWEGAFCQVGGSPSFQHALDLRPEAPEPGSVSEPYAYFVLRFTGEKILTVHKRYVSL